MGKAKTKDPAAVLPAPGPFIVYCKEKVSVESHTPPPKVQTVSVT